MRACIRRTLLSSLLVSALFSMWVLRFTSNSLSSAEPSSAERQNTTVEEAPPRLDPSSPPAEKPPLPKARQPLDDPLYQSILRELRSERNSLLDEKDDGSSPGEGPRQSESSSASPKLSHDEWLAIELLLRSARLIERNGSPRGGDGSSFHDKHRAKIAAEIRALAQRLLEIAPLSPEVEP